MQKTIKIGEREVALRPSAATPYRYTNVFHENFFTAIESVMKTEDGLDSMETVSKLCYIMAMQAEGADMNALNEQTFEEWLDQYSFMELSNALGDVLEVYTDSAKTNVAPK